MDEWTNKQVNDWINEWIDKWGSGDASECMDKLAR